MPEETELKCPECGNTNHNDMKVSHCGNYLICVKEDKIGNICMGIVKQLTDKVKYTR